ncbi:MAG TPA: family 78 glycoside hydrolase catalytic domain [Puia sp.]|nr:family 78 glycoside hydrolase catalytic domain [Puia sp.]
MQRSICVLATLLAIGFPSFCQLALRHLQTENLTDPLCVDSKVPRFSWLLESSDRNELQTAYEIRVSGRPDGKDLIWTSGKVGSQASIHVEYGGSELQSGKRYFWQVRIWDNKGRVSPWSERAWWQMGLLRPQDWKARWIRPADTAGDAANPLLRTHFSISRPVASATVYITAHGLYEARLNGQRIGDAYLTPGWTSYKKRLQYQAYDVSGLLRNGANAIGAMLGNGWYRGTIGFSNNHDFYGRDISLLLQLIIRYKDGSSDTIATGPDWRSSTGEVRSAEIYNGERIDYHFAKSGWSLPGYDDSRWSAVQAETFQLDNLLATVNEPVRKHETFNALRLITTPKGEQVLDFGQNLVGWVVVRLKGHPADSIVLSHAEVLDKNGNFYTENLRAAKAEDTYIPGDNGGEAEVFEPHFTFHGFRYVRVRGWKGPVDIGDFTAVALYSDMPKTGSFTSSDPLINQLQHNIQWGQQGNFLDVPTDCPQRDERLGWTGDAQVFSRTATFNRDVENFFAKWLKDVAADQFPSGSVPFVIPDVIGAGGSTGWADVATIIPWNVYLAYGDERVLRDQYPSMKAWVEYMRGQAKDDLWNTGFHFGDWLFYRPFDDNDGRSAVTDKYLIAQCFYAHSTQLLINAADVLGKKDDVAAYTALLQKIKAAFLREYVTPGGRLVSGTQTAYVLALEFDMLPATLREQAVQRLIKNIQDYGYHLTTGFLGTPYLCHVLSDFGYVSVAYRLLMQDTYPSWLYPVKMGATTIWERWDGVKPDSTFQTPGMNSFNHYAYGAIGDWMYRVIAGLDTYAADPGYHHSRIDPHPGGGLTAAGADLQTGYGLLSSHWRMAGDTLYMDVVIPANTTSSVFIPAPDGGQITESNHPLATVREITVENVGRGFVVARVGSGEYHFRASR